MSRCSAGSRDAIAGFDWSLGPLALTGWCLQRGYGVIGQMDCDLSHPPEKLVELRRAMTARDAGLVLASRYLPGGGTDGSSRARLAMSRLGCAASRLVLHLPALKRPAAASSCGAPTASWRPTRTLLSAGCAFQLETTKLAQLAGARIEEVPFVFCERVAGTTKMTPRISLEGIRVTLALRRQHGASRRLPVAL